MDKKPKATPVAQPSTTRVPPAQQRDMLERSESEASNEQPQNYKGGAAKRKVVKIPPVDKRDDSIKGLDNE